ncbi:MAG: hypothetical protein PF630_07510 [Gammaproteobacteria bacterium]|nr:hypothetical protein [Gammaproteobacteria bacterium]
MIMKTRIDSKIGCINLKNVFRALIYILSVTITFTLQASDISCQKNNTHIDKLQFRRFLHLNFYTDKNLLVSVTRYSRYREAMSTADMYSIADKAFDNKKYTTALRYYMRLAKYGDKYVHLKIGFIHVQGLGEVDLDAGRGMAWLELAREVSFSNDKVSNDIDNIWLQLNQLDRCKAQQWLNKIWPMYSNLALMANLDNYYERYLLNRGGTRLKNTMDRINPRFDNTVERFIDPDSGEIYTLNRSFSITREYQYVTEILRSMGSVRLGELSLIEDDQDDSESNDDESVDDESKDESEDND